MRALDVELCVLAWDADQGWVGEEIGGLDAILVAVVRLLGLARAP